MRLAIIDLDWLDKLIKDNKNSIMITHGLKIVREAATPFPKSFSLSTLNMKSSDLKTYQVPTEAKQMP